MRIAISEWFEAFAAEKQIAFYEGVIDKIADAKPAYPCLWLAPPQMVMNSTDSSMMYNIVLYILSNDKILKTGETGGIAAIERGKAEIWENMERMALDIKDRLRDKTGDIYVESWDFKPFDFPLTNAREFGLRCEYKLLTYECDTTEYPIFRRVD